MKPHGSHSRYCAGCRCRRCKRAHAEYTKPRLAAERAESREDVLADVAAKHGPEVAALIEQDWQRNVKGGPPREPKVYRYRRLKRSTIPPRRPSTTRDR